MKKIIINWKIVLIIGSIILINTLIFSVLSITRHYHYFSQGNDLALYEQIIWQYSHGQLAFSSLTNLLDIADRFRPIIFFFVIPYKFLPFTETLLIAQAFLISLTTLPLFLLCRKVTRSLFLSTCVSVSFLAFIGTQSLQMNDFHELCALPFLLACTFYFLEIRNWKGYWIFLILSIMVREYIGFLSIGIAIYVFISSKNKKNALLTAVFGFTWSACAILIVMPALGQTAYQNFLGNNASFSSEILQLILHPWSTFSKMFIPFVKLKTIFVSFASFGFLPILYPPMFFPAGIQLAERFLDEAHPYRWTYFFQYSADLAAMLSVSTIYAAKFVSNKLKTYKKIYSYLGLWIFASVLISQAILPVPIKLLFKKVYYEKKQYVEVNNKMLSMIPEGFSVSTQNSLASHLAKRKKLYLLPKVLDAKYIAVDFRPNQDLYNFFGVPPAKIKKQIDKLVASKKYRGIYKKQEALLLIKNEN
jgi:uncharacterized membrane protein